MKKDIKSYLKMTVFVLLLILIVAFFAGLLPIAPVVVATGSMEPAISVGDIVLVCETDPEQLETGDIIQYQKDSYSVIHRIVECHEKEEEVTGFITKGDYNNAPDNDEVLPEQVEGRVILIIPDIGKFILSIHGFSSKS